MGLGGFQTEKERGGPRYRVTNNYDKLETNLAGYYVSPGKRKRKREKPSFLLRFLISKHFECVSFISNYLAFMLSTHLLG